MSGPSDENRPDGTRDPHVSEHQCLDLLQGLLSPAEEERVLAHLSECPGCEGLLQEWAAEAERLEATRTLVVRPGEEIVVQRRGTALRAPAKGTQSLGDWLGSMWNRLATACRPPRAQIAGGGGTVYAGVWF